jgi:translocation and assembly module TamA
VHTHFLKKLKRTALSWLLFLALLIPMYCGAEVNLTVKISGVDGDLLENVHAHLSIQQRKSEKALKERWVRILHADAPDEIRAALEPYGYYSVQVQDSLDQIGDKWVASYEISLGEPTKISSLDVRFLGEGAGTDVLDAAIESFPLKVGDVLDHDRYEQAREALVEAAVRLGYVKANPAEARVLVNPEANSAEVTLHIDTGQRFYFGKVRIQQDFLNQELVEKFVSLKAGDPYDIKQVLAFQQGLQVTDWASVVRVDPRFEDAVDGQVPLDLTLQPSKRNRYAFGIGYETDIGPRGSASWTHRRINPAGHHSNISLNLSSVRRTLGGTYYIPVREPLTDRLALSAQYEYEETSDTNRNTFEADAAFVRQSLDGKSFYQGFLELRNEESEATGEPSVTSNLFSIGATKRFTELARGIFPQDGYNFQIDLRGASSRVFSDTSYIRLLTGGRKLYPLGANGRFRLHGELGVSTVEFFELYPTSLHFFAGGDNSIRGYDYKSLGPKNEAGNVVGGKNLLVLSGEYEHRIADAWALAGFIDAGNAFNNDLDELHIGAGAGFRWLSRFGSLRVDFAWPVSDDEVEFQDAVVHLGFGMAL